jgi:hypothetical protein
MAVQADTSRVQYAGNASTTQAYPVPFPFFSTTHLRCIVTTNGVDAPMNFVATGEGNPNGGSLTTVTAVPATSTVTIYREVPATQTTSYVEGGDFPAASHERALDKLTMLVQQIMGTLKRTVRVAQSSGETQEIPQIAGANKLLGTDGNGDLGVYDRTTVAVGSTTTGAAGSNAQVTNTGTATSPVLEFSIPGSPTVNAGTTTTTAPGTQASVTAAGTAFARQFNFSIPRGDKGETGLQGLTGPQGGLLNWRGNWSSVTAYAVNDVVNHNGALYFATASNTNVTPTNTSHWQPAGTALPTSENVRSRYDHTDRMFKTRARWPNTTYGSLGTQLRILTFGDSYAYSPFEWLMGQLGNGGVLYDPQNATRAGGATLVSTVIDNSTVQSWSYSTNFNYVNLVAGSTATYRQTSYVPLEVTQTVWVYYVARSGGGTFKIQTDENESGTWTDVPGGTINTDNAGDDTITRFFYDFGNGNERARRVRVVGESGTCRLLYAGCLTGNTTMRNNGVTFMNVAQGGTVPQQWDTVKQANFTALLQAYDPHLIFVCCAETLQSLQTHWPSVSDKFRTACPNADFIIMGSHPTSFVPSAKESEPTDEYFRLWCDQNNFDFVDVRPLFPDWQRTDSVGQAIFADGVHLAPRGYQIMQNAVVDRLRWLAPAQNRNILPSFSVSPALSDLTLQKADMKSTAGPILRFQDLTGTNGSQLGGFTVYPCRNPDGTTRLVLGNNQAYTMVMGSGVAVTSGFAYIGADYTNPSGSGGFPRSAFDAAVLYGPSIIASVGSGALGTTAIQRWRFGTDRTNNGTNVGALYIDGSFALAKELVLNQSGTNTAVCGRAQLVGGTVTINNTATQSYAAGGLWSVLVSYEGMTNPANAGHLWVAVGLNTITINSTNANDNNTVNWLAFRRHSNSIA